MNSAHSAVARYVLDNTPPKITIISPKDGDVVNRAAVDIKGKTQARATLIGKNADNGASFTASADADGSFTLTVASHRRDQRDHHHRDRSCRQPVRRLR